MSLTSQSVSPSQNYHHAPNFSTVLSLRPSLLLFSEAAAQGFSSQSTIVFVASAILVSHLTVSQSGSWPGTASIKVPQACVRF